MARTGKFNFDDFKKLQQRMSNLKNKDIDKFFEDAAKELAARLLAQLIRRTPVGVYEDKQVSFTTAKGEEVSFFASAGGKKGGTLRRGWTAESHGEAESGGGSSGTAYAQSLPIQKIGNTFMIEIKNPVEYAEWVESGHRTRNHKGWVAGQFMMKISEEEVGNQAPRIIERQLRQLLGGLFQ